MTCLSMYKEVDFGRARRGSALDGQAAQRPGAEYPARRDLPPRGGLRSRRRDEDAQKDEQIRRLKQKVGELVLDLDILKEATKDRPFGARTSDE